MAATQTDQRTIIFSAAGDNVATAQDILTFDIVSASASAGDVVEMRDAENGDIIGHYVLDGANYCKQFLVASRWSGIWMQTNTADRATVYCHLSHRILAAQNV